MGEKYGVLFVNEGDIFMQKMPDFLGQNLEDYSFGIYHCSTVF